MTGTFRTKGRRLQGGCMHFSVDGGLTEMINRIVAAKDGRQIISLFKDLILRAYGEKSADGKRFIKTQDLRDAFAQTEAYSDLFMELATDANAAANFVNGIVPAQKAAVPMSADQTPLKVLETGSASV